MSLEKLESAIIAEANNEADKIVTEAKKEAEILYNKFGQENKKKFDEAVVHSETAAARETVRLIGIARHEGRLSVLREKNNVIDIVFSKASEYYDNLSDNEKKELFEKWLMTLSPEISGTIRLNPKDADLLKNGFLEKINSGRDEKSKILSIVPDKNISGGFIIDGENFSADFIFEKKLKELRESLAGELAKELFES
jgi:vacuolar-type H+-ATPase subunit E/Vma4